MLGMDGIRGREQEALDIIPLQDILKALLLITTILLAEGLPFLRRSGVARHHFYLLASLGGIGDRAGPTPDPDESNPHLVPSGHGYFLLLSEDFSELLADWQIFIIILFVDYYLSNHFCIREKVLFFSARLPV
jgi:hypothetical protein